MLPYTLPTLPRNQQFLDGPESPFKPWQLPGNSCLTDHFHSTAIHSQASNIPVENTPLLPQTHALLTPFWLLQLANKQLLALVTVLLFLGSLLRTLKV